jgi:hypothetical protein
VTVVVAEHVLGHLLGGAAAGVAGALLAVSLGGGGGVGEGLEPGALGLLLAGPGAQALRAEHVALERALFDAPQDAPPVGLVGREALHEGVEAKPLPRRAQLLAVHELKPPVDVLALHPGHGLLDAREVLLVFDPQALQAALELLELLVDLVGRHSGVITRLSK